LFLSIIKERKDVTGLKPRRKYMGGGRGGRENAEDDRKEVYTS